MTSPRHRTNLTCYTLFVTFIFLSLKASSCIPSPETLDLGKDTVMCVGQQWLLNPGDFCGVSYRWQDGSTGQTMLIREPGAYSLELTDGMRITKDVINVVYFPSVNVNLGNNAVICPGQSVTFDASQDSPAEYRWNDGSTVATKIVNEPGTYWVQVKYVCNQATDSVTLSRPVPVLLELGDDKILCESQKIILDPNVAGTVAYRWQDGSSATQFEVTTTGTYSVKISNGCDTAEDSIHVFVLDRNELIIPNIITPNDDQLNDYFVLPDKLVGSMLSIYNRWGDTIFFSNNYQNTWKAPGLPSGVYFFTLQGECIAIPRKGAIHVVR